MTFDNAGVGGSTGTTPSTITQMARDAIAFLDALELGQVDLLGFSIGSFVAQEIALIRPARGPSPGPRVLGPARRRRDARLGARGDRRRRRARSPAPTGTSASSSRARPRAGKRAGDPGAPDAHGATTGTRRRPGRPGRLSTTRCATWGIPDHALLQRLSAIGMPVFVANGDSDPMILPHYSYLLAGLIPQARVKIYPDAAHGFLFQHHAEFAGDVDAFLTR